MRKVLVNGKEVDATQVQFEGIAEPWAEYHLSDGRIARIKWVLTKIFRTEEHAPNGDQVYSFEGQAILSIEEVDKASVN